MVVAYAEQALAAPAETHHMMEKRAIRTGSAVAPSSIRPATGRHRARRRAGSVGGGCVDTGFAANRPIPCETNRSSTLLLPRGAHDHALDVFAVLGAH